METKADQIIEVMRQRHGRDISMYNRSFLQRSLEKRRLATASPSPSDYLRRLSDDRAEADSLFDSMTISFSEFFRNPLTFGLLEQVILPGLVEAREKSGRAELRIWSAGCAAGQEAYSVAILIQELAGARGKAIPFRIFATDISETELEAGRRGVYDESAVRNVRLRHLQSYFARQGESFVIARQIRDRVDFSGHDLLDEHSSCPAASIFGDFELVLCSNLLFYYRPALREIILRKALRCLSANGYFVTGEAERDYVGQAGELRALSPPMAVFQKIGRSVHHE